MFMRDSQSEFPLNSTVRSRAIDQHIGSGVEQKMHQHLGFFYLSSVFIFLDCTTHTNASLTFSLSPNRNDARKTGAQKVSHAQLFTSSPSSRAHLKVVIDSSNARYNCNSSPVLNRKLMKIKLIPIENVYKITSHYLPPTYL